MSLFDLKCPVCNSRDWFTVERDEHGINLIIECSQCHVQRGRKQQPVESLE